MSLVLIFAVAALLCAAFGFSKEPYTKVAVVLLSIGMILLAAGANPKIF